MRRISIISMLALLICSACNKASPFEDSMRSGKDALKECNYEDALRYFDIAIIEEPTNKDALALYERSKNSLHEKIDREEKEKLASDMKNIIIQYEYDRQEVVSNIKDLIINLGKVDFTLREKSDVKTKIDSLYDTVGELIESMKPPGEVVRLTDLRLIQLDELLLESIVHLDGYYNHIMGSGSVFKSIGVKRAIEELENWDRKVATYK